MAGFNRTALRREIGKVQRLCCLGLGGQMLIPALIRELQAILPCYNANFWWGGPHQGISNVYVAIGNPEPISIYYEEFYQRRERDVWLTFAEGMRTLYPTAGDLYQRILKVDRRDYFKSDLYNLVMRPLGGDQVLHRRFAEHGRGLGSLQLCRKSKESSFSANDCKLLDGIARFVAHGMTSAPRDQV